MGKWIAAIIIAVILAGSYAFIRNNQSIIRQTAVKPTMPVTQITNSGMLQPTNAPELVTQEVTYYRDVKGFLAKPKKEGVYPGVVMIHEWWGLNDNIKDMAKALAADGYTVLAVDLYHGKVAKTPQEAQQFVGSIDRTDTINNMKAAYEYLKKDGSRKIASLGWCFGGGQSLQLALSGVPLNATVLYYGTPLVTDPTKLAAIKWPVLGIFGDKDQSIPVNQVNEFKTSLDKVGVPNEIHIYPGVGHAFANPTGQNYAPDATKDAWEKTLAFLQKNLK